MKKKDIIGVLSETTTRGDLNEFFDKAEYLFGVLSGGFNVRKYEEQGVVEALATVHVLVQAIIAKLGYIKKVSKAEEKLILDIIKANLAHSDKDDNNEFVDDDFDAEGFDDFDAKGFDDFDAKCLDDFDAEGFDDFDAEGSDDFDAEGSDDFDAEGSDDFEDSDDDEGFDDDGDFSFDESSDDSDFKISENTDDKLNDISQDLDFDSDEDFTFGEDEEEDSDFDAELEGLDDLDDYCSDDFNNDYDRVDTKTNLKNFKDHSGSSTNDSESDLASENLKRLLDIFSNENKKD